MTMSGSTKECLDVELSDETQESVLEYLQEIRTILVNTIDSVVECKKGRMFKNTVKPLKDADEVTVTIMKRINSIREAGIVADTDEIIREKNRVGKFIAESDKRKDVYDALKQYQKIGYLIEGALLQPEDKNYFEDKMKFLDNIFAD